MLKQEKSTTAWLPISRWCTPSAGVEIDAFNVDLYKKYKQDAERTACSVFCVCAHVLKNLHWEEKGSLQRDNGCVEQLLGSTRTRTVMSETFTFHWQRPNIFTMVYCSVVSMYYLWFQ